MVLGISKGSCGGCGAITTRINPATESAVITYPKEPLPTLFFLRSPAVANSAEKYMPSYIVTAYCEKCSVNHPTAVELDWPEQIPPNQSIAEVFDGTFLPPEIAMMSRNYFLCPQTGKMNKQTDSTKTFLAKTK